MAETPKKSCLIIGAGAGLGASLARAFAAEGLAVCVTRRPRHMDELEGLAKEINDSGGEAHAFGLDARDEDDVQKLVDKIETDIGPLDVMVFNIGANVWFPITQTTTRVYSKVWEMAALSGFLTGRESARVMSPRGEGTILFTGASASIRGRSHFSAFASAKHSLRALAQSMARELHPKGIHIGHFVIDGGIWNPSREGRMNAPDNPGSMLCPDAIAESYWHFLAQDRSSWAWEIELRPWVERF